MCGTRTACAWKEGGQSQYLCNFAGLFPPGKASSTFETASADHQRIEKMLLSLFLSYSRSSAVCSALRRLNRNCIFFITLFSGDAEGFENHLFSRYLQEREERPKVERLFGNTIFLVGRTSTQTIFYSSLDLFWKLKKSFFRAPGSKENENQWSARPRLDFYMNIKNGFFSFLLLLEKRRRIAPEQIVNSRRFKAAATVVNAPLTSESRKLV